MEQTPSFFSSFSLFLLGLGGAVGYMLGGLDWTGTLLGRVFKSQEQVLFVFAAVIFSFSVVLHLFSIPEQPHDPAHKLDPAGDEDSASQLTLRPNGHALPHIDIIVEGGGLYPRGRQSRC